MIIASIDIETSGDNPLRHMILEFGAVIEDTENPRPFNELPKFHTYIDNGDEIVGTPFALQMNAETLRKLATEKYTSSTPCVTPNQLGYAFRNFLIDIGFPKCEKIQINAAGKNFASFDKQFLNNCPHFNDAIEFSRRSIDPAIYYVDWTIDKELPNLDTCLQRAGIDKVVTHNAVEDAIDVLRVLRPFFTK